MKMKMPSVWQLSDWGHPALAPQSLSSRSPKTRSCFVRFGKAERLIRTLKGSPATQMAEWSGKEILNIRLHWELAVAAFAF